MSFPDRRLHREGCVPGKLVLERDEAEAIAMADFFFFLMGKAAGKGRKSLMKCFRSGEWGGETGKGKEIPAAATVSVFFEYLWTYVTAF